MTSASARGLFRATGKTSRPMPVRLLDGSYTKTDSLEREKDEFYPTPVEPTRAFLAAEIDRLRQFSRIWEPAAGDGAMVREIRSLGLHTYHSDLVDRGCGAEIRDFYSFKRSAHLPQAIITNPPFNECNWRDGQARWLYHAIEELQVGYMALLMSWSWPGAGGLKHFWAKHPAARVYLMRWKIDFTGQGAPPMLNAWFVWDRKHVGETILRMLDRATDARQSSMFDEAVA